MANVQVHVFVGPVCDYSVAPIARYSPYWQTPVLSAGAMAHNFGTDKHAEYGLLTRVGVTCVPISPITCDSHALRLTCDCRRVSFSHLGLVVFVFNSPVTGIVSPLTWDCLV